MTQDQSSKLSFSIEESVWLNKDKEVDEIVSLSLEPEITVQESGENVFIRGGLKLTGEYRSDGKGDSSDGSPLLSDQVAFRSIEEITMNEDGTGEIRHSFPIDVTIPKERINSLDDIYVVVDSFDYDLLERGCIQFTADVSIIGMSTERIEIGKSQSGEQVIEPVEVEEDRSFHYEAYEVASSKLEEVEEVDKDEVLKEKQVGRQEESSEEQEDRLEDERKNQADELEANEERDEVNVLFEQQADQQIEDLEANCETSQADHRSEAHEVELDLEHSEETQEELMAEVNEIKIPSVSFGVVKDQSNQEIDEKNDIIELDQNQDQSLGALKSLSKKRKEGELQTITEEEVVEELIQEDVTETTKAENALYLTKMLTNGEEDFKKLKLCIIQANETLEIIANRYKINESTIIRMNRLNDSNVEEGQILYIPVTQ